MKRILALCFLLVLALGAAQAQAAPFYFGSAAFDDQATLLENLGTLVPEGSDASFQDLTKSGIIGLTNRYVTLIALSESAYNTGFYMMVNDGSGYNTKIVEGSNLADTWIPEGSLAGSLGTDVSFLAGGMYDLGDLNMDVVGAYMFGTTLVYKPAGDFAAIEFTGGTIFAAVSFGGSNTIDAIIAISRSEFSVVPVPGAVWLLGTGLAGIVALRRRNK